MLPDGNTGREQSGVCGDSGLEVCKGASHTISELRVESLAVDRQCLLFVWLPA